jgi:hypothetical protein
MRDFYIVAAAATLAAVMFAAAKTKFAADSALTIGPA